MSWRRWVRRAAGRREQGRGATVKKRWMNGRLRPRRRWAGGPWAGAGPVTYRVQRPRTSEELPVVTAAPLITAPLRVPIPLGARGGEVEVSRLWRTTTPRPQSVRGAGVPDTGVWERREKRARGKDGLRHDGNGHVPTHPGTRPRVGGGHEALGLALGARRHLRGGENSPPSLSGPACAALCHGHRPDRRRRARPPAGQWIGRPRWKHLTNAPLRPRRLGFPCPACGSGAPRLRARAGDPRSWPPFAPARQKTIQTGPQSGSGAPLAPTGPPSARHDTGPPFPRGASVPPDPCARLSGRHLVD